MVQTNRDRLPSSRFVLRAPVVVAAEVPGPPVALFFAALATEFFPEIAVAVAAGVSVCGDTKDKKRDEEQDMKKTHRESSQLRGRNPEGFLQIRDKTHGNFGMGHGESEQYLESIRSGPVLIHWLIHWCRQRLNDWLQLHGLRNNFMQHRLRHRSHTHWDQLPNILRDHLPNFLHVRRLSTCACRERTSDRTLLSRTRMHSAT
jgi:hypothetical protein